MSFASMVGGQPLLGQACQLQVDGALSLAEGFVGDLQRCRDRLGRGSVEVVVEPQVSCEYLWRLIRAGLVVYYGMGLPKQPLLLLDRREAYSLRPVPVGGYEYHRRANGDDPYIRLLWHRFGIAIAFHGKVIRVDGPKGIFCLRIEGIKEQWCRFKESAAMAVPALGTQVEALDWQKMELADYRAR